MTYRRVRARSAKQPTPRSARGAILLEIVLAIGLFVATGMVLLSVVGGAIDSLNRSRDRQIAADHARNALAMIEAGIARPETLNGPVAAWSGADNAEGGEFDPGGAPDMGGLGPDETGSPGGGFQAGPMPGGGIDEGTGWSLEIETERTATGGLTLVIVRAFRTDDSGGGLDGGASYTLRQIMLLESASAGEGGFGSDFGSAGESSRRTSTAGRGTP